MKRAILLTVVLGLSMSVIYMLPPFRQAECALNLKIPERLGLAQTVSYPPSQAELNILSADTDFSKAHCYLPRLEERSFITGESPVDQLDLSIVLSGYDLANSIHRPELCMPAQGHEITSKGRATLDLENGQKIPVTRLLSTLSFETGPPDDRRPVSVDSLTYYFFVGQSKIANSHLDRVLTDIKDRVLFGEAQRWAYVSVGMRYLDQESPPRGAPPNLKSADKKIRELLKELADSNIDWDKVGS